MKTAEEIQQLIEKGETHNVEFKSKFEVEKVGQAICSLSNDWPETGSGILLIGVTDTTKSITGVSETEDEIQQSIANICRTAISPPIAPVVHVTNLEKPIIVVEITATHESPCRYKNDCYIRIGTTTRKASFNEETDLDKRIKSKANQKIVTPESQDLFKCDAPPTNMKWVGRALELRQLSDPNFKVVFITGIGGQGKSGLASHYITNVVGKRDEYEYWDWRDLKEEEYRLNSKVISIIERLTHGKVNATMLKDETTEELIKALFHYIGNRRIVFVFDNIDRYVDTKTLLLTGGFNTLVDMALTKDHNCKFLLTCRPSIRQIGVGFYDLNLDGLTLQNAIQLFEDYKIQMKSEDLNDLVTEAYQLTMGHPLWLNLIAAQALRGRDTALRFIDGIKYNRTNLPVEDDFSILSENVLKTVWDNLSQNQRILLRGMSEMVRAETEAKLVKMLDGVLHFNKFNKALRVLKALNLIVIKSSENEPDMLELHPLVRSFVVNKYNLQERSKYIHVLIEYYNRYIILFRKQLHSLAVRDLDTWLDKIELNINEKNYKSALSSLEEIHSHLLISGKVEEYIRVSHLLFTRLDWSNPVVRKLPYFYSQFDHYIRKLIEFGKFDDADIELKKYEKSCTGRELTEYYDYRCYSDWYQQRFEAAVIWGQRYWDALKANEPNCSAPHNLLLSWRDSGETENVKKALDGFRGSEPLKDILSKSRVKPELGSAFYGNIGKCFWYGKQLDKAMICYKKSLQLLYSEKFESTELNKGYASQWIADILIQQHDHDKASLFYQNALIKWRRISPFRSRKIQERLSGIFFVYPDCQRVSTMGESDIEESCKKYVE